jgi:hypothetical protein
MLGPFNHVPPPRDKAHQKVALSVLLVVVALCLLMTGLSVALPPAGAELPAQPDRVTRLPDKFEAPGLLEMLALRIPSDPYSPDCR